MCGSLPVLFVGDTNAGPATKMQHLIRGHGLDWGTCSDPGRFYKTCCHDGEAGPGQYARYRSDRIAFCGGRGGVINQFEVGPNFTCGSLEEHLSIFATAILQSATKIDTARTFVT